MAPITPAATQAQIEALLNFMEGHHDLARGLLRGADGSMRSKRLWEDLCNSLNALGGCTKSIEQWQRVWADKKHLTKKAAGAARRSACATGGGPSQAPALSHIELRIMQIMGEGFGEPETEARVPAFPTHPTPTPVGQLPVAATISEILHEPTPTELLELQLASNSSQRSINAPRARRIRRPIADSTRNRILELEERRLQADLTRNEQLILMNQNHRDILESNQEVKAALLELCGLVREYIIKNN